MFYRKLSTCRNITVLILVIFLLAICCQAHAGNNKIPWAQRHFPNAPRISAKDALKLLLQGRKIIIVDIPWTDKEYYESHICGAIKGPPLYVKQLDRFIKKIPKNYIILSYCK